MLEVLMNSIDCELENGIQPHPGNIQFENIKLLWKEKLLKRVNEMNDKDKEGACEQIFKVDREPSLVLPPNDYPSFDLELTPTPSNVNIVSDKQDVSNQEPVLDNEPLTFRRISEKLKLPPKRQKSRNQPQLRQL
nr:hypothetical protein [Tanacetum cinerariifolium]